MIYIVVEFDHVVWRRKIPWIRFSLYPHLMGVTLFHYDETKHMNSKDVLSDWKQKKKKFLIESLTQWRKIIW